MKSDIQIAQEAKMKNIREIAAELNLSEDDIDQYGKYKCKISLDVLKKNENKEDGKLILVTAINPTPAGEGKSTVTVGLGQALCKKGKKAVIALREPSLGPVFGVKGGAAGGGPRPGGSVGRVGARACGGGRPAGRAGAGCVGGCRSLARRGFGCCGTGAVGGVREAKLVQQRVRGLSRVLEVP